MKTRRGRGRKPTSLEIFYLNIRGFKSKADSLEIIINSQNPDVVVLCEIKCVSPCVVRKFFKALGYDVLIKKKSGIAIAAKHKLDIIEVSKSVHDNLLAGSVKIGSTELSIIAVYGLQETDQAETRLEFYEELSIEIQASQERSSNTVLVGDFNAKVSMHDDVVVADSPNGGLLVNMIQQFDLNVLNFNDKCEGVWTRVQQKKDIVERSIIDYVITTKSMELVPTKMVIDEEKLLAPYWIRQNKNKGPQRQYSDHNSISVSFQAPSYKHLHAKENVTSVGGWNLTAEGLEKFKELTETPVPLKSAYDSNLVQEFSTHVSNTMDACFTKKKKPRSGRHPNVNSNKLVNHHTLHKITKKLALLTHQGKTEKSVAKEYIQYIHEIQDSFLQSKRSRKIADTMGKLTDESGKITVDKFWKLKKSLSCPDRSKASIVTRNNVELFSPAAIKKEYAEEFRNRLSHKQIDPAFAEYEKTTQLLFKIILDSSMSCQEEPPFSLKEVKDAATSLNAPSSSGTDHLPPDVYVNAGEGFFVALTRVLNMVKESLQIPPEWFELLIVTIFKNKGSRKQLEFYRGIFLSNIITKILEKVIKNRIRAYLKNANPLQAGSRENRSTCDTLFLVYGAIDHAKYLRKQLFITLYDYSTCFDSLWLEDSMISLWDLGITSELFALIYKLNETAKIQVKTPFGLTEQFECSRIVKQGSVLSSNLCSTSTAQLCDENYLGGIYTGNFVLNDVLYVDDTTDLNDDINEADESNQNIVNFSKRKRLNLNHPKCGVLTINGKPHHSKPRLKIGDGEIPQVKTAKLLGDVLNEKGNNTDLTEDKSKKAKAAMVNCLAMCNEVTMGMFFVKSSMILYQSVFLFILSFNCQIWRNMTKTDLKQLETTQLQYLKRVMRAPLSTPNSFVFLELGTLPISYVIHSRQLSFLHHILHLEENDPVKQMYVSQTLLPYEKNWANEVNPLLEKYDLSREDILSVSKETWKRKIKHNVTQKAFQDLNNNIINKSKTKHLSYQSFSTQDYVLSYHHKQSSTIFKLRSRSIDCKANRKSNNAADLRCRLCKAVEETQSHIINCPEVCDGHVVDISVIDGLVVPPNDPLVMDICQRVDKFNHMVNNMDNVNDNE